MLAYQEKSWYSFLKRKYSLDDITMEEYINSFIMINNGDEITPISLVNLIRSYYPDDYVSKSEAAKIIKNINKKIRGAHKPESYDDTHLKIRVYLSYIIPICHNCHITQLDIKELYDKLDTDGDGKITCKEMIDVLYKININMSGKTFEKYKNELKKMCKDVDTNGDGYITFDEFKQFMRSKKICKSKKIQ